MLKILIIHPEDNTTKFLSSIYEDIECTVIKDSNISSSKIKQAIKEHDIIIMLGHGTESGLIDMSKNKIRYIVNSSLVYLLKDKQCICIWCNADKFVKKYKIKGFYTGMIISEVEEAYMCGIFNIEEREVEESNILFSKVLREALQHRSFEKYMKTHYSSKNNPIIIYNSQNIYQNTSIYI